MRYLTALFCKHCRIGYPVPDDLDKTMRAGGWSPMDQVPGARECRPAPPPPPPPWMQHLATGALYHAKHESKLRFLPPDLVREDDECARYQSRPHKMPLSSRPLWSPVHEPGMLYRIDLKASSSYTSVHAIHVELARLTGDRVRPGNG